MMTDTSISRPIFLTISLLMILLGGLLTVINLTEWYTISILEKTADYPFGGEGPTPYYYKTSDIYATVHLAWGLIFLATLAFSTWTIIKGQRKRTLFTFALTLLLLTAMFVQG